MIWLTGLVIPPMSARSRIFIYGVLISLATCIHYPLMYAYRSVWVSQFPEYVKFWPNDGRFTQIGLYGLDDADTQTYAAVVQDFSRHWQPHDPFVLTDAPRFPTDYLTFRALGGLRLLIGDMNATWLIVRLLACLVWFILLFRTALLLSIPESPALFCAAFCTCFSYVMGFYFISDLHWSGNFIKTAMHAAYSIALYGRTEGVWRIPRPGVTDAALFAAILIWGRTVASRAISPWVLSGVLGGLLAYVRIHVWSGYLGAACLFPLLQAAFLRRWEWRWSLPAAITLLLSYPILVWAIHPPADFLVRSGMASGGNVDWKALAYIPIIIWILSRRRDAITVFLAALLISVVAICNVSVITGHALNTDPWRGYAGIYLFILTVSLLPRRWLNQRRLWNAGVAVIVGGTLALNIGYAGIRYPWHGLPSTHDEALLWLEAHARPDSVVAVLGPEANVLIPIFTPLKTLVGNGEPLHSIISIEENIQRIIFALHILGGDPRVFIKTIIELPLSEFSRRSLNRAKLDFGGLYLRFFEHYPSHLVLEKLDLALRERSPRQFPVDYVWVGPFERLWLAPRFPESSPLPLQRVFSNGVIEIYSVKSGRGH